MSNVVQLPSPKKPSGKQRQFSVIAAVALNGTIGDSTSNTIPWHLPKDFKWFKECTAGKTVIMGSHTFESIGRPLPKRRNVVITRDIIKAIRYCAEGVDETNGSFINALDKEDDANTFVIGGQAIYEASLNLNPAKLFITIVNRNVEGDVKFPIGGDHFHDDVVIAPNGTRYVCAYRSEWHEHNDVQFQFTRFDRD
jgi:dihydrofolate reductase